MADVRGLVELLRPARLTEVVDIGANPIDGAPPYRGMLEAGLCKVTGFEPQASALAALETKKGPLERYLPYAVGDGGTHVLNVCKGSGMTSLLRPDRANLSLFNPLLALAEVIEEIPLQTRRLDDVVEITQLDYLKIDIQGSELAVFRHGRNRLRDAVAIQVEVSFITLYENQPALGEVDLELRAQGFVPHCAAAIKKWPIAPCVVNNNPYQPLNQLLEADLVYVRDFARPDGLSDEQLKHLALVAHHAYGSMDLALRCLMILEQRGVLATGLHQTYLTWAISSR